MPSQTKVHSAGKELKSDIMAVSTPNKAIDTPTRRLNGKKWPRDGITETTPEVAINGDADHKSPGTSKRGRTFSNNHSSPVMSPAASPAEEKKAQRDDVGVIHASSSSAQPSWGTTAELSDLEEALDLGDRTLTCSFDSTGDDDSWRHGLEELRRRKQKTLERERSSGNLSRAASISASRLDGDELADLIRAAVRGASWTAVTMPSIPPKLAAVTSAVRGLHDHEVRELVRVCATRYETHPRQRSLCAVWIMQVLSLRSATLVGQRELREALRPLFKKLAARFGQMRRGGQVLACLGKWKLVRSLAGQARRRILEAEADGDEDAADDAKDDADAGDDEDGDADDDNGDDDDAAEGDDDDSDDA